MGVVSKNRQSHIASLGGIPIVLASMAAHRKDSTVQWAGCWALFCLSVRNSSVQALIRSRQGLQLVLQAMIAHRSVAKVQEAGCWSLKELSDPSDFAAERMDCAVAVTR